MESDKTIVPLPLLYFQDVSKDCSSDILERSGGRIFCVYLFDANTHVFCASVTPSFEMELIDIIPVVWPEDETLRDNLESDLQGSILHEDRFSYFDASGWLRAATSGSSEIPDSWDGTTAPAVMRVNKPDPTDAEVWQNYLDENDGNIRVAHAAFMEETLEDIYANARY